MGAAHRCLKVGRMKRKFVIIGGGVAGLSAAIRLTELGEEPLLIEGGSYPAHKICGEFLSPECLGYLKSWNIHPVAISQAILNTQTSHFAFPFPTQAGGISHLQLDPALAKYASECGAEILTNTLVHSFQPKKQANDPHLIQLSTHETIEALNVIIATGRYPNNSNKAPTMRYLGFKAHFEKIPVKDDALHMFFFPGAYLGISPIEDNKFNVACLADLRLMDNTGSSAFIRHLVSQNPQLNSLLSEGKNLFNLKTAVQDNKVMQNFELESLSMEADHSQKVKAASIESDYGSKDCVNSLSSNAWMAASIPDFGMKQTPDWQDAYFIGDAAVTVPPACGNGLSMAICGGRLAAEYSIGQQPSDFKAMWTKRCASQLFWAKILHKLMLTPSYGTPLMRLSCHFPFIAKTLFELTRHP